MDVLLPFAAALVSLRLAGELFRRWRSRRAPELLGWGASLAAFAAASGALAWAGGAGAVLQLNFRGSTGYGRKFWEASRKQWGLAMQDDITDGVEWLIREGVADPKRVCIYGASYGGYATLMGLVKTPDLYACGIDYVGVSNLFTFMKAIPPYWKPLLAMFEDMVGDPVADKEQLTRTSPALNAERIKAPLLVAQGARDPRVVKAESDQMVAALKARGIDVPYLVKDNEGHGFANEENQLEFYGEMERFLAKYLD
jgi:dipeptidyl aminopeptidase/acylaminoacyl peptidase